MPPTTVEVNQVSPDKLLVLLKGTGLEEESITSLRQSFQPIADILAAPLAEAALINVTSPTQITEIKKAHDVRMTLRDARIACEKLRKKLKEQYLIGGKAVDAVAKHFMEPLESQEARLLDMETIAARMENERKDKRRAEREAQMRQFTDDVSLYNLREMTDDQFQSALEGCRLAKEQRAAEAKRLEEERKAEAAAREAEQQRLREENERLRQERAKLEAEAAERHRKLTAEREALEAQARADREAREAVERKAAEEKAAAEKKARAEAEAAKRAARAPDKTKLINFGNALLAVPLPIVSSPEADAILKNAIDQLSRLTAQIDSAANAL